jgi:carbon-monoxide dehydrogenase large subunit
MGSAVRWSETRNENMLAMTHGRGQVQHVELGATLDGRMLGLRVFVIQDIGAYASEAATLPPLTGLMASGPYRIPRIDFHAVSVVTTTTPVGAYRGAGRPEATWLLERALDMLAAELGIDPAEIRRRNFIPPEAFPYRTPTGANYDSGDPGQALDIALRAAGYAELRQEQAARLGRGETCQLGIGICTYVEVTGWGSEFASVGVDDLGTFTVLTGTSPQGQGHETAWAQIVADTLGVPFDAVTVRHSDTLLVPRGEGTMGSRSLQVGGSAVLRASVALLDKARRLAAHLLETSADDIRRLDGRIGVGGAPELSISWGELAAAAADPSSLPPGMETGLRAQNDFEMDRGRGGGHRDGKGEAGPSCRGGRLRAPHQPDARRRADPRGDRAGRRPGAVRIIRLRRRGQSADVQPRHIRDAERGGPPLIRHRPAYDPH